MKIDNKPYTIVYDEVLENDDFNIQEQSLYMSILSYHNKEKGYAFPSYEHLKKRSKIKRNETLIKTINSLIYKGYLKKETVKGIGCKYYITVPSGEVTPTETINKEVPQQKKKREKNKSESKVYIDLSFVDEIVDKVKLTKEEYDKLIAKFGASVVNKIILNLDNYIANGKGGKYKDHYRTLNTWCTKEVQHSKSEGKREQITAKEVEALWD